MLERILSRASALVFVRHRAIICLFALITAASVYTVFHMDIRTDLIDVLPGDNPAVARIRDFMQKYNVLDSVTIIISSKPGTIEEYSDLIEGISGKLSRSPLIHQVDYTAFGKNNEYFIKNFPLFLDESGLERLSERFSPGGIQRQIRLDYERLISPLGSPADDELISRDPLNLREIISESMKRSGPDNPFDLSMGYYITRDHSTALIFVKPSGGSRDMSFVRKLRPELDSIINSSLDGVGHPAGVSIQLTGGYIFNDEVRQVIRHDIISSTLISVVLIGLIIWIAYRVRPVVLGIVACTTFASLSMTLAVAYLIFGSLNIVTSIVCGLLIGMYVDYCILTLKRYGDELLLSGDRRSALETTMTRAGASMLMSALTTSLSFFSIIVTGFDGLHELGIVAGLGVLICFAVTFLMMNSMLVLVSADGRGILSVRKTSSGVERLSALISRYPGRISLIGFLIIGLLAMGLAVLRFDSDPEHIGLRASKAVSAMKALNQKLRNSGEPLEILIKAKDDRELFSSFDRLDTLLRQWKAQRLINSFDSLAGIIPPPHVQREAAATMERLARNHPLDPKEVKSHIIGQMEKYGINYDSERLGAYVSTAVGAFNSHHLLGLEDLEGAGNSRVGRFYNKGDRSMVAYLYSGTKGWDGLTIESIRKGIEKEGAGWSLIGSPILYGEIKASILKGSSLAALITLGLNILFVAWFLRKGRYVAIAMLPVCLGFLITPAIMGWIGAPYNFINVGTMALIFGFGVDYGIYIMQSYLREDMRDINNALKLSGKNVVMCAATTIAGCGSLITADFAGIASIGLVLTIGAVCCSAITLLLLPSLLWLIERRSDHGRI